MYQCLLINRWWTADNPLEHYIQRTGCLDLVWAGAYSDEALQKLQFEAYDLVFFSLPTPGTLISEPFLAELRRQKSLILTSLYPEHLFKEYELTPVFFLEEPFSITQFQKAMEKYFDCIED